MARFDDSIISSYLQISDNLLRSRDEINSRLTTSSPIDKQTKILLRYLTSESLSMLSLIFKHSTIFMRLLNEDYLTVTSFEKFVDSLPNEFHIQKKQWKKDIAELKLNTDSQIETIRTKLSDYDKISDFVRWETKLREDEVKEKENPSGQ